MSTTSWTTDPVHLPGVDPADPPTELVPGALWHGGCPVDFGWVRATGIDVVLDLADADAHPPAEEIEGLIYLKWPARGPRHGPRRGADPAPRRAGRRAWSATATARSRTAPSGATGRD